MKGTKRKSTKRKSTKRKRPNNKYTHKRNRVKSKCRAKTHKRYRKSRGGGFTLKQVGERDEFRNVFITDFNNLEKALESNDKTKIKQQMSKFKANIMANKLGINTLIPMTVTSRPIQKLDNSSKQEQTTLEALVPFLVIIFKNVNNDIIRNEFVRVFKKNTGNINLKSPIKDISALSTAIELNDTNLVNFLLSDNIGADKNILTEEQKVLLENLLQSKKEEDVPTLQEDVVVNTKLGVEHELIEPPVSLHVPIIKLNISTELLSDTDYELKYGPDIEEPEFWRPLFGEGELTTLRKNIHSIMENDLKIPFIEPENNTVSDTWSICKIIQTIIPTYHVPNKNQPNTINGTTHYDRNEDFARFNIILCTALLIYGVISHKMNGQDYSLIFKGGKATQLVLSQIPEMPAYETDDIDVLVIPNVDIPYDEIKVKNLAGHISYLIKWFLNKQEKDINSISVMSPNPDNKRANPYIFKLSYVKNPWSFKQFSDVDFKDIPKDINPYIDNTVDYPFDISELNTKILFKCPNIGALLDEKIHYFSKYVELKGILASGSKITEPGYETTTIADCDRYIEKFKRSILVMNNGLQKMRSPELTSSERNAKERTSILSRLQKINVTDPVIIGNVVEALYPIKQ